MAVHAARLSVMNSLGRLLAEGIYSDLTITCGGDTYKAHKAIVCTQSSFFEKACGNEFFKEGETGAVDLQEVDPALVKLIMNCLYHFDYQIESHKYVPANEAPCPGPVETSPRISKKISRKRPRATSSELEKMTDSDIRSPSNLLIHAKVYALDERYGIPNLKGAAREKFNAEAKRGWNASDFPQAIEEVNTSTLSEDQGLRDIVYRTIRENPTLIDRKEVQEVLQREDVGFDLSRLFFKNASGNDVKLAKPRR